jgi:hypothetical protein
MENTLTITEAPVLLKRDEAISHETFFISPTSYEGVLWWNANTKIFKEGYNVVEVCELMQNAGLRLDDDFIIVGD